MRSELFTRGHSLELRCLYEGERCRLIQFLDNLSEREMDKVFGYIEHIAEHGPPNNIEKYRKLRGVEELWELKIAKVRIIVFYARPDRMILAHGFRKRSRRTPPKEIARAEHLRDEYLAERGTDNEH